MKGYLEYKEAANFLKHVKFRLKANISFNKGFLIPLIFSLFPAVLGNFWVVFVLLNIIIFTALQFLCVWFWLHYIGPVIGLYFVLVMQGFRVLGWARWRGFRIGRLLVVLLLIYTVSGAIYGMRGMPLGREGYPWGLERAGIIEALEKDRNKHLILVSCGPNFYAVPNAFVYNDADIDDAKVVWARKMDDVQNRRLLKYFKDRRVWLLEVKSDRVAPRLLPFRGKTDL